MKKVYIIFLTALSIMTTIQTFTMQQAGIKAAAPHFTKKIFSSSMTGIHWLIAAGDSLYSGAQNAKTLLNEKKSLEKLNNADQEITDFILSTLEKTNYVNIDAIKINPSYDFFGIPMGTFNKHIMLAPETDSEIKQALATNDQIILNKWRATLEHENSHRKHNDLWWRVAADITLPFLTHTSVKIIRNAIPIAKKTRSFISEQCIKIPTAFGKNLITTISKFTVQKHQEQRADNEISDDINMLVGKKTVLSENEQKRIKFFNPSNKLSPKQYEWLIWSLNFFESHPLPNERIKKLDERIALLRNQSPDNERTIL
ncbi:MAG TPA: M48 family metalloprotease [Candidatus Babeliales bacterium]|nr:M48 family metalloprotease [Candidatus Babeliales bacterium]